MTDRAVAGSAFKYAVTDSASDDRFAAVRQALANDDSHLDDDACAKLLANHQPRELVEHRAQRRRGLVAAWARALRSLHPARTGRRRGASARA